MEWYLVYFHYLLSITELVQFTNKCYGRVMEHNKTLIYMILKMRAQYKEDFERKQQKVLQTIATK
jgi:hypothetical protein